MPTEATKPLVVLRLAVPLPERHMPMGGRQIAPPWRCLYWRSQTVVSTGNSNNTSNSNNRSSSSSSNNNNNNNNNSSSSSSSSNNSNSNSRVKVKMASSLDGKRYTYTTILVYQKQCLQPIPSYSRWLPLHSFQVTDPSSGKVYYANVSTGESSWDAPLIKPPSSQQTRRSFVADSTSRANPRASFSSVMKPDSAFDAGAISVIEYNHRILLRVLSEQILLLTSFLP